MTTLTAPLIDRDLTAPDRVLGANIYSGDTRITRAGNTRITRLGDTRVTRSSELLQYIVLTAPLVDRELTAQERQ